MTDAAVQVENLLKVSDVPEREAGLRAAAKSLVRRTTREVRAVDGISCEIAPGEIRRLPRPERRASSVRNSRGAPAVLWGLLGTAA